MKAKEWVEKLQSLPESEQPAEERFADFFKEFGEETAKLVTDRTKYSKPESKFSASEGAVREQRNKFQSICTSFPTLSVGMFDSILEKAFPEWKQMVESEKKRREKKKEESDHGNEGRRFGKKKQQQQRR